MCDERTGNLRQRKIICREGATNSRRDRMRNICIGIAAAVRSMMRSSILEASML